MYCAAGERKHEIAEEHLSTKQVKPGLFLVLVSKAPALVWEAQKTGTANSASWRPKIRGPTSIIIPFISWIRTGDT